MATLPNFLNNPNQPQPADISLIDVSATGKVIFYKGDQPVLALGKVYNLYIDITSDEPCIYFIIEERGWIYKFTFYSLTDLNGKSYTAQDSFVATPEEKIDKVVEVYEDLNALFAACCASSGGGGTVDSIVAGNDIDVDATDPANPIVGVTPHTFVRLPGTESGFPITGDFQRFKEQLTAGSSAISDYIGDLTTKSARINFVHILSGLGVDDYRIQLYYRDVVASIINYLEVNTSGVQILVSSGKTITLTGSDARYSLDYSSSYTNRSLVDKEYVDNAISAATGTSKSYLGGRGVISMAASAATFIPIYSLSGTNTGQGNDLTNYAARSMTLLEDTTFLGISVSTSSAQPATGSISVTLVVNGVDSSLVLTIPAGSAAGQYTTTGSVACSAGDTVAWKYSNAASTTSAAINACFSLITIP